MKIVAFAQIPLAITMVVGGSLRGAGDTGFIMFATIAGMWFVRLPICGVACRHREDRHTVMCGR